MSYGYKIINLNTAEPYLISNIIGDYLSIKDYETLKNIGLTQSIINELESGIPFYDPSRIYGLSNTLDFITTGRINPPVDLNIPGDLYKIAFVTPDDPRYTGGYANGRRTSNLRSSVSARPTNSIAGENSQLSGNYVNPSLINFETAPSVNRLFSLWNAYGGSRSFIMTSLTGHGITINPLDYLRVESTLGYAPELQNYPVDYIPFGQRSSNFYYTFHNYMAAFNDGQISGFNYDRMRQIWAEGRDAYNRNMLDPATGDLYRADEVTHDFGVNGKFQVPSYMNIFKGGNDYKRRQYLYSYDNVNNYCAVDILTDSPYSVTGHFAHVGNGYQTVEDTIAVQLPSGQILAEPGRVGDHIPWLEWPQVWDGNIYRPFESPLGQLILLGDQGPWIEFQKEISEHYIAMREWFDAGCPCDWQDWGGYVDPTVAAQAAQEEDKKIADANAYQPTIVSSATPPSTPKFGDLWFNTNTGKTFVFKEQNANTGTWVENN